MQTRTNAIIKHLPLGSSTAKSNDDDSQADLSRRIGAILVESGTLSLDQAANVLDVQRSTGERFGVIAIRLGLCNSQAISAALARQYRSPQLLGRDRTMLAPHLQTILGDPRTCNEFTKAVTHLELRWFNGSEDRKCLSFVSSSPGEGCSTTVAMLAILFAQSDRRVLVIDAACQTASQLQLLGVTRQAVTLEQALEDPALCVHASMPLDPLDLHVLASSAPLDLPQYLQGKQFAHLLDIAGLQYDVVLIDTPPTSERADAFTLAMRSSGAVAIVRLQKSRDVLTRKLVSGVRDSGVELVGVIGTNF